MKKTKAISLILVSAALASCQKDFLPVQSNRNNAIDSTLLADPEYAEVMSPSPCTSCCNYTPQNYQQLWSYSFNPIGNINPFPVKERYYYHWQKGKYIVQTGMKTVVRSGWGNTAMTTAVTS